MLAIPIKENSVPDGGYGRVTTQYADFEGITLESGVFLGPLRVAYETYRPSIPQSG